MEIWSSEIKELERLHESLKGHFPELEKELEQLIRTEDANVVMLYSRRCLEVIITDLCECELKRLRKTEPLKGIIDKLHKDEKVPSNIITSMHGLNELSTYGAHPKDFDPEQVKPVLNNLDIIIKWFLKYKDLQVTGIPKSEAKRYETEFYGAYPEEKSIAVLPFVDMSPEKNLDYFCDGITEEIINTLAHNEDLKVIARTSAFAFKNKDEDIREIGKRLGVKTVLEGSIRRAGNRLRITAQLIKVDDGSHLWSDRYDREIEDIFAIQDEISQSILTNLKVKLFGEKKSIIPKLHSENLEAYNLYLKGTYYWQMLTVEGYKKATEYFEQALQKDPNYSLAYSGLCYAIAYSTAWGNIPPNKGWQKIFEYSIKILEIKSNLAEAYSGFAGINLYFHWNWKEAERNYLRALQINPNSSQIHLDYSNFLTFNGRHEEAISEAKRAQELDPLSIYINTYTGVAFDYAGQYDRAIKEYLMTLAINPNYFITHYHFGRAYAAKGMIKESLAEYEKAIDLSGGIPLAVAALACSYYLIGKKDQADKLFESLKKRSEIEYVPATTIYLIHRVRGEEAKALEWLKRACNEHDSLLPWFRAHSFLIPKGSKYMKLLIEMGLDY